MSKLGWGKPKIEYGTSSAGAVAATFTEITADVVEGTAELTPTAGTETEAKGEGGEVVDSRKGPNAYAFSFELYVAKGFAAPIASNDGVVSGEYSVRVTPEDTACEGFLMPVCRVSVETTWKSDVGKKLKYIFKGLKPATGNILQDYTSQ